MKKNYSSKSKPKAVAKKVTNKFTAAMARKLTVKKQGEISIQREKDRKINTTKELESIYNEIISAAANGKGFIDYQLDHIKYDVSMIEDELTKCGYEVTTRIEYGFLKDEGDIDEREDITKFVIRW